MVASSSSVATYLDVAHAAKLSAATPSSSSSADPALENRVQVLAAINRGTGLASAIAAQLELPIDETLAVLAWLSQNGLVELKQSDSGEISAELSDVTRKALTQD